MNRIKDIALKIYFWILWPVRDNPVFFLFTFMMNEILLIMGHCYAQDTNLFLGTLLPLFDGYIFCLLTSVLRRIHLHWISWIGYLIIVLGEAFSMVCYHSEYSISVLQLVMQTNMQESTEFISQTILTPAPWIAIAWVVGAAVLAYVLHWISDRYLPYKGRTIMSVVVCIVIIWSATREIHEYSCVVRSFLAKDTTLLGDPQHLPCRCSSSTRLGYSIAFNYVSAKELNHLVEDVAQTQVAGCSYTCPTIVLMIGESYSKYHTPLYVPDYPMVSPDLCRLRKSGHLCLMNQAVSPSNLTSVVMKQIFATPHSLFPAVFRKAGYKVYFLSNQFCIDDDDTWNLVGGTIFNHPQLSSLQFDYRNSHTYPYDGQLLEDLPPMDTLLAKPSLIIFHVMGQHVAYSSRYPAGSDYFTAQDVQPAYGGHQAREILAAYDNATLYNDSVIAALWQRFDKTDAIGIYLSDHGEEVYDYRNYYERSDMNHMDANAAKYQLDIPMMFLMTDSFLTRHPDLTQAIHLAEDRPFCSTDLYHALLHLAGIDYIDYLPQRDVLSPLYQ